MTPLEQKPTPAELKAQGERNQAIMRENPFDSLRSTIAFDVADWSQSRRMAWLYGIICGWSDSPEDDGGAMAELAAKYNWSVTECERLKRLHESFCAIAKESGSILFR